MLHTYRNQSTSFDISITFVWVKVNNGTFYPCFYVIFLIQLYMIGEKHDENHDERQILRNYNLLRI